jgi:hypothetical protein
MTQQTAVEWFYEQLYGTPRTIWEEELNQILEQANQMFQEQIEKAYDKGAEESWDSEQYYEKTYKEPEEPKPAPEAYYAGWLGLFENRTDIKLGNHDTTGESR